MARGDRFDWDEDAWSVATLPALRAPADPFIARALEHPKLLLTDTLLASPSARRGAPAALELRVRTSPREAAVLVARHPSGAITLHGPERAAASRGGRTLLFRVSAGSRPARRALEGAIRLFVLRALGRAADRALPELSRSWEDTRREKSGLHTGFVRVTREGLLAGRLPRAAREIAALPPPPARSLVLVHGIFSDAESAFRSFATTGHGAYLARLEELYEGRVFAFNHPTVGTSPLENARAFLEALPERRSLLDVLTHSRGGVVVRALAEHRALAREAERRLELGRAVLVAAPNGGSALASPERWEEAMTWLANLDEVFPLSALSCAGDLVAESLVWIARRAGGGIPGIAALAPGSAFLSQLSGSLADRASAVATNFVPPPALLPRLADAGMDLFFGAANDLVVPTEGGYRLGASAGAAVGGARVLCFGPGGNAGSSARHHLDVFDAEEALAFVLDALRGEAHPQKPHDVSRTLPRRAERRGRAGKRGTRIATAIAPAPAARRGAGRTRERLELVLLPASPGKATLLASWGGARAVCELATRGGEAGERMRRIIALHERILRTFDGRIAAPLPGEGELAECGALLFETLFPDAARRLYDEARSRANGRRLDVVFTSSLDWVADKPWELAYDARRGAFLAAEDVNFVRGVVSAVPSEVRRPRRGPLRVLVASAQPRGLPRLSTAEEAHGVAASLAPLVDAGLVRVETLTKATPERLHAALEASPTDVLHFIGHGLWRDKEKTGALVLEAAKGAPKELEAAALRRLLAGRGLRLVFLNACESARGSRTDFNRGVAPALAAAGIPAVLANQYSVLDTAATTFARRFYGGLALGRSLGDAAREARVAVGLEDAESIAWATPVLFARDPSLSLCARRSKGKGA